jgi:23S rRNA pseudouridine1911/1915/1917 synthase
VNRKTPETGRLDRERVIYSGPSCLVLNKLPGEFAEKLNPGGGRPVHRLDTPVSGCLLLARTDQALAFLSQSFRKGRIQKRYLAVTELSPPGREISETGELVHFIMHDARRNKSAALTEEKPGSKKAVLRYRLLDRGKHYLFMEIHLLTGRPHQIRAQLAALGVPVKGDLKYGARRSEKTGGIRLHAASLAFPNPLEQDETIRVEAPLPFHDPLWDALEESYRMKREF